MGTRIDSVMTVRARRMPFARGALRLSDLAARACLEAAHREAAEIDLLVNAGLYKEKNMAEPALASIIEEDIGANPGHPPVADHHGTFSFDVANGGCGVLTAAYLIDGFARSGSVRLGMVVAGDADPSPRTSRGFRFSGAAGAMLLEASDGDEGFDGFELRTFPELAPLFDSRLVWEPGRGPMHLGHNILVVREAAEYAQRCVDCATRVVHAFLDRARLLTSDIDLLVASPRPMGFPEELARELDIDASRVSLVAPELASAHTAGTLAALETAIRTGQLARSRRALFVSAGAGVTIGVALYVTARAKRSPTS